MKKKFHFILLFLFSLPAVAQTGESASSLESALPHPREAPSEKIIYSFSAQTSVGSLRTGADNIDNLPGTTTDNSARYTIFTPQIGIDLKDAFFSSAFLAVPLYWDSSADSSSSRTYGRPEIGIGKILMDSDNFTVEADLSVRLPLYGDSSGYFVEGNRVFQIAPLVSTDTRLFKSKFHMFNSARVSYDTKASVALPVGNDGTAGHSLERPLVLRLAAGIEFDQRTFTIGTGVHTTNWLGSGKIADENSVLLEASPLDLLYVEISGTCQIQEKTKLNLSITKGVKTRSDFYTLIQQDAPEEIADGSFTLGLTRVF